MLWGVLQRKDSGVHDVHNKVDEVPVQGAGCDVGRHACI